MNLSVPVVNHSSELSECRDRWFFDETYQVWCLEDILYTQKATTPTYQRMSIFVPGTYLNGDGKVNPNGRMGRFTAKTAPVVFENNAAGYMQMPHTWLGGPRDEAEKYLRRGMVYVSCGCRGRESRDQNGRLCGKSPWTLVDLKTGIRFLRHNAAVLPGDFSRIISVGWSAGGAMSTLVGVTGNHPDFEPFLVENGAFMDEKDDVFAAQIYCPIIDLDHADLAYEWQFHADEENTDSPAGPAGRMTPFRKALSGVLMEEYITYFNSLELKDPDSGERLVIHADGRSGSGYDYLMRQLEASATEYLTRLDRKGLPVSYSSEDYLTGNYVYQAPAPLPNPGTGKKDDLGLHHAGAAVALPPRDGPEGPGPAEKKPMSLGELLLRPPKGVPYHGFERPTIETRGKDKRDWLSWDGEKASIRSLDAYILAHYHRMKPCTSFDTLGMDSGENQEFGTAERDYMHFSEYLAPAIERLREAFPEEYARYYEGYAAVPGDEALAKRRHLINPMEYIGQAGKCDQASHYRIRVGAQDPDTAFTISMALALKLAECGKDTDYKLIWDRPHCEADYPGEVCDWIEKIV
ncbi:MAG: hypothetical protein IJ088_11230 [Clostridia bacterium]|nr:hypothetical protein [Clostridia bacterium]